MILFLTAILSAIMIFLNGCAAPVYQTLEELPQYSDSKLSVDTSGIIRFVPYSNEQLNKAMIENFSKKNYSNVVCQKNYKAAPVQFIVTPLSLLLKTIKCKEGIYIESRLIIEVRKPGYVWLETLHAPGGRYFQAFSRIFTGSRPITDADYHALIKETVANLFRIDEFLLALVPERELLQNTSDSATLLSPHDNLMRAIREKNKHDIIRWAFIASESGDQRADKLLAAYALASENICGDNKRRISILTRLAEKGTATAQMQLASMYEKGTEVPRDLKAAFNWYMKAASQNSGLAQYKVGYMYEKGLGTGKNISQALHWYTQAVRNKNAAARKRLLQLKKIKDHR